MNGDSPGGVMLAVGALMATLCGSCTLYFLTTTNRYDHAWWSVSLVVGGIPALIGVVLFVLGFWHLRRERQGDQ